MPFLVIAVYLFLKFCKWLILNDSGEKREAAKKARKAGMPYYEVKGQYYDTETRGELFKYYNRLTHDYEYKDSYGYVVYSEVEGWRKEREIESENTWNSTFQWDSFPETNKWVLNGIRYKDKATGHFLVIRTVDVNRKACKVYLDINTRTYIRKTDGQINHEMRYKLFCPDRKDVLIDADELKKVLSEKTESLKKALQTDWHHPDKKFLLSEHQCDLYTGEYEEAKMEWFGTEEEKQLLTERNDNYQWCRTLPRYGKGNYKDEMF